MKSKTVRTVFLAVLIVVCFNVFKVMAVPTRVVDLTVISVSGTNVTLQWTVPNTALTLQSNDMRVSTSPINSLNWASRTKVTGVPIVGATGAIQQITVAGLNANTTYYFAIKVSDTSGWSTLSNLAATQTGSAYASVTLAWDPNTEPDLAGYKVYWGPTSGNGVDTSAYTSNLDVGLVTTCTISNIVHGSITYFVVTAYNSSGLESLPSNEVAYTAP